VPAVARDWEHAATTSLARLRQLAPHPGVNYGVACGPSDLIVIDLDVAKDPRELAEGGPTEGWSVLRELAEAQGGELPRTFTVRTPSGGRHLYFRPTVDGPTPRNTVRRLGPLIDTRGVGGYVVAPGSRVDGVEYRVIDDAPIAVLPEWISALLRPMEDRPVAGEPLSLATALGPVRSQLGGAYAHSALEREAAHVAAARIGTRNDTLNRAAYSLGTLVGSGLLDRSEVELELTRAALAAGLDARETASTVRSGLTAGIARPRRLVGASAAAAGVHQLTVADAAETHRALIPTLVPAARRVAARLRQARAARPGRDRRAPRARGDDPRLRTPVGVRAPRGPSGPGGSGSAGGRADRAGRTAGGARRGVRAAAQASGPIVGSARWQGILALVDALRDLNDELARPPRNPGGELSPQAFTLVRALSSAAARQIVTLAKEIAIGSARRACAARRCGTGCAGSSATPRRWPPSAPRSAR
jgi:hypothetical protein